jgi:hypothetical protein
MSTQVRLAWLILSAALSAATCGGTPTQPYASTQVQPTSVVNVILGRATDTAFRAVAGVRVEMVGGPAAGIASVSDQNGYVSLRGSFSGPVTLSAAKAGYLSSTQVVDAATYPNVEFIMESPDTVATLEPGSYALTYVADPSCNHLPPELRSRTYAATLTRAHGAYAGGYFVDVPGMLFGQSRFILGLSGNYLVTDDGQYPTLFENVSPDTYLGIDFLIMTTTVQVVNPSEISVTFPGSFEYCKVSSGMAPNFCDFFSPPNVVAHDRCFAEHNQMILARR